MAMGLISMFGQTPVPVKAGDRAPNLTWTKIVASEAGSPEPQSLLGQNTVLLFLRPVSHNQETVERWNGLVEHFSGKAVNFVWIANEKEDTLFPFLKSHPVRGWLVLDPEEESYGAYGVEGSAGVFVDPHGIVTGFTLWAPEQDQVQAVLDGRGIVVEGEPTEDQLDALFEGKAVRLDAKPYRHPPPPPPPQKPDLPPSDEVHISLSKENGTISSVGPDHWMHRGFDLRAILSTVSGISPTRIDLPAALDGGTKYDFVLVPPQQEDEATMIRQVREAIEKHFHVRVTPETRSMDVYVVTAIAGKTPPAKETDDQSFAGVTTFTTERYEMKLPEGTAPTRKAVEEATRAAMEGAEFQRAMAMAQLVGMSAISNSMDEFRRALEDGLHRPVVDETGLTGIYDFKVKGEARTTEEFLGMLRDQLGLVVTPGRRSIGVLAVRGVQ